jgi:hypothetical protein
MWGQTDAGRRSAERQWRDEMQERGMTIVMQSHGLLNV